MEDNKPYPPIKNDNESRQGTPSAAFFVPVLNSRVLLKKKEMKHENQ